MTEAQRNRLKNVVLYILKNFSGGADYIKLYKIMYFANREQLAQVGVPLVCDNFKAWRFGPVPAFTGSVIKCYENDEPLTQDMKIFANVLKVRKNKLVKALEKPDEDSLPPLSRRIIDEIVGKCKYKSWKELSRMSHDAAWSEAFYNPKTSRNGGTTIQPYLMAAVGCAPTQILESVIDFYSKDPQKYNRWTKSKQLAAFERAVMEIHSLQDLTEDWDGEGAYPVKIGAALNCRRLISKLRSSVENISDIYATPTGNICIDWNIDGNVLSSEMSETQFGFYYENADGRDSFDSEVMPAEEASFELLYVFIDKCHNAR